MCLHHLFVEREIKRNTGKRGYRFKQADAKACERRSGQIQSPKKITPEFVDLIKEKLELDWRPEKYLVG